VFAGAASIPLQVLGVGDGKWCGMIAIGRAEQSLTCSFQNSKRDAAG
jgi:hypothetical protein